MLINYTRELRLLFHLNKWLFGVPYDWDEVSQSISPISSRKHDRSFTLASWILRTQILWTLISLLLSMLGENTAMSYFVGGCTIWQVGLLIIREAHKCPATVREGAGLFKAILHLDGETTLNRKGSF
jgi:hypothetical protein